MESLVKSILENKKSVREIIDEQVLSEGPLSDLADAMEPENGQTTQDASDDVQNDPEQDQIQDEGKYLHLFVRRFKKGQDKPYKRSKMEDAPSALALFFEWADHYKQDTCEIWSDVAGDAKDFYRFCLKNRDFVENLWKGSQRMRKESRLFPAAYRDIQARARQSGTNITGTFYPFRCDSTE